MNKLAIITDREDRLADPKLRHLVLNVVDDVWPVLCAEAKAIDRELDNYISWCEYQAMVAKYPEVKFLEQYRAVEAWSVTKSIGSVLTRIKNFVTRVIQYVGGFVLLRFGAVEQQINAWIKALGANADAVQKFEDETINSRDVTVDTLNAFFLRAGKLFRAFQDKCRFCSSLTPEQAKDPEFSKKLIEKPEGYAEYIEALNNIQAENPHATKTVNNNKGKNPKDGEWTDVTAMKELVRSISIIHSQMDGLKSMKANCEKMISELETADTSTSAEKTDNDGGKAKANLNEVLKNLKLKFLKDFTANVLTGLLNAAPKWATYVGKLCEQYTKQVDPAEKSTTGGENNNP